MVQQACPPTAAEVFYKSWGAIFPPAAVLTGTLAGAASTAGPMNGASFLVRPRREFSDLLEDKFMYEC